MRSKERVDVRGVGRSMGYGFVEFTDHDSALSALRATNNNPDLFGKDKVRLEFRSEVRRSIYTDFL